MKIYINLSKKEVRKMSFANTFWDVVRWRALLTVVLLFAILSMLSLVILDPANIPFGASFAGMVAVIGAAFGGLRALNALAAISSYWQENTGNVPDYMETNDDGFSYCSHDMRNVYLWETVLYVYETKHFFFIATSNESRLAIPRRCFADQSQLDSFVAILKTNIVKKRLHLKNYPIGISAPDSFEDVVPISTEKLDEEILAEAAAGEELFSLRFFLHTKDILGPFLRQYYKSGPIIIGNLVGLLIIFAFICGAYNGNLWDQELITSIFMVALLLFSLFFVFYPPIMLVKNLKKQFGKNSDTNIEFAFKFYHEYYLANMDNKLSRFYWKDLVKTVDTKNAYWLYVSKKEFHIIPKRVFADAKDEEDMMKKLLQDCI